MDPINQQHLSANELLDLVDAGMTPHATERWEAHLDTCEACRVALEEFRIADREFSRARGTGSPSPGDCPDGEVWHRMAAGLTAQEDALRWLGHASRCGPCAQNLVEAREEIADADTNEIGPAVKVPALPFPVNPPNIAFMPAAIARSESPAGLSGLLKLRRWHWIAAVAFSALAIVLAVNVFRRTPAVETERLLTRAYAEQRPFEWRLPENSWGTVRAVKGSTGSEFDRPAALIEAQLFIKRHTSADPASTEWLRLRAEAEILNGQYDAALSSLEHLAERAPLDARVLSELGCAHALKGDSSGGLQEYSVALDKFSAALKAAPDAPAVVFNRAIVLERLTLYDQAEAEWNRFLRLDPGTNWAGEARKHLAALAEKKTTGR